MVEVDHVDIMTLIEMFIGSDGGTRQPFNQVFTLYVGFAESRIGRFSAILLCSGVDNVGIEVEVLIALFPHSLT